jgi:hypothetical protein
MTAPQADDQPPPPIRPLTLTVELLPDPLNDLLAGRLIVLLLQQLWAHDTKARIQLCEQQPHRRPGRTRQPMWTTASDHAIIGLDIGEVIELVETLEELTTWLHDAPPEVKTCWNQRTGGAYPLTSLCADLLSWTELLGTRTPLP